MGIKLTQKQLNLKEELATEIEEAGEQLEKAIDDLQSKASRWNELMEKARELCQEVHDKAEEYIDEKSDKWRESDRGNACEDFKCEWEGQDENFSDYDFDAEDRPDYNEIAETLRNLPEEPDEV